MAENGTLYLIPTIIADDTQGQVIPPQVRDALVNIDTFLVEDVRTARRYLSSLRIYASIESLAFHILNKDTQPADVGPMMKPLFEGKNIGIISESGCPGVADPGSLAVAYAHGKSVKVVPLVGPSSILLALMASGLGGQRFVFHGYLPIDAGAAAEQLRVLEKESRKKAQTQVFIETPYRNNQVFGTLLRTLHPSTALTVAIDITGKNEMIKTQTIEQWSKEKREWPKMPAVFLFLS